MCNEVAGFLCNHLPISWHHGQPVLANWLHDLIFHIWILCIVYFFLCCWPYVVHDYDGRMLKKSIYVIYNFTLLCRQFQTDFLIKSCIQVISLQYSWNFFRLEKRSTLWILQKWGGRTWTGFVCFSIHTIDSLFVNVVINVHFQKGQKISWPEWLSIFQAWIFLLQSVFISTSGAVFSVFPVHMLMTHTPCVTGSVIGYPLCIFWQRCIEAAAT